MFKRAFILSVIALCPYSVLYGQETDEVSYYLDDDGLSKRKNLIKLNPLSIISGEVPVFYERILGKKLGMEVGLGILLPYFNPEFPELLFNTSIEVPDPVGGYSWYFFPKIYFGRDAPESTYMGFQIRKRNFNLEEHELVVTDLTVNFGALLLVRKSITVESNWSLGFRLKTMESEDIKNEVQGLAYPFTIKIGYLF